ncbi:MAG: BatD family protein [Prevotella sp.]|nr:BatD family protein [Prevotella sp.]
MRRVFVIISFAFCALMMSAQVFVESKIDSIQILIGEQTDLTLSVTAKKGAKVKMPSYKPQQQITQGVEVVETLSADTTKQDNGLVKISKKYTLTSFDENLYYLPPMTVQVDGKKYQTKSLALKVLTVPVDTLHPEKFYPPKDVQDNPFLWSEWKPAFWLSLIFVLLNVLIYYLWTRLKDNKPVIARVRIIKKVLPHQKALKEIERIKEEKMSVSDDQKTYYTLLTDVVRKYIYERFGFNAMEMTSSEIIARLREDGDQKMIDELKELFVTADLVKFAKYSTLINENDANLVSAIEFINTTKQENQPTVERVEPKLTEDDKRNMRSRTVLKGCIIAFIIISIALLVLTVYQVCLLF